MTTIENASWKGDVWIDDDWTAEDKAKALEILALPSVVQANKQHQQQHQDEEQQQQQLQVVFKEFRRNASTNWNSFYEQNQTNFFKDRHYLHKTFPSEFAWLYAHSSDNKQLDESGNPRHYSIPERKKNDEFTIVEIGCGVGNAILPLLEQHTELTHKHASSDCGDDDDDVPPPRLTIHCLDFAPTAIHLLKQDPRFKAAAEEGRATAHVFDLSSMHPSSVSTSSKTTTTTNDDKQTTLANSADVAILLFCLSAIGPHPSAALSRAARHAIDVLKPGGTLVIRDYGRLDEAQMKLSRGEKRLGSNFYRKGDGTGCYYFELQDLKDLFVNNEGDCTKLELLELDFIQRIYRNRGDNSTRRRVWIQGRFRKPLASVKECKGVVASIGCIGDYSSTAKRRWDNYYSTTRMSALPLPSNLFQIFSNEFSPWQSLMKQGMKGNPKNLQPPEPSYTVSDDVTIVDLGCGLGNACLLNLIQTLQQQKPGEEVSPKVNVHFLDISAKAIEKLSNDERYQNGIASGSVTSQVYDVRQPLTIPKHLEHNVDIVLLLYAMSAIGPHNCDDLRNAVTNAINMLKPGGVVLFRDYGRYDDDQLQLNSVSGSQLCNNFYLRDVDDGDEIDGSNRSELGTGCYFFELDEVREMFEGLEVLQLELATRTYKKTGRSAKDLNKNGGAAERRRIWIQGRFRKPLTC
jgi:methyltransferase-like protein 6